MINTASNTVVATIPAGSQPVGAGVSPDGARAEGNTTGFMQFEYGLSGKWLELMKEIMPNIARIGVIRDDEIGTGSWSALHSGP